MRIVHRDGTRTEQPTQFTETDIALLRYVHVPLTEMACHEFTAGPLCTQLGHSDECRVYWQQFKYALWGGGPSPC